MCLLDEKTFLNSFFLIVDEIVHLIQCLGDHVEVWRIHLGDYLKNLLVVGRRLGNVPEKIEWIIG